MSTSKKVFPSLKEEKNAPNIMITNRLPYSVKNHIPYMDETKIANIVDIIW